MASGIVFEPPAFDTLGAALELENAGFVREQAQALAKTIARAHNVAASREDLDNAVSEIKRAIAALEKRQDATEAKLEALQKEVAAIREKMVTKEDLAMMVEMMRNEWRADLAKQKNELLVWMFSFGIGIAALSITITQLLD